jgi:Domain of unknown function (DUF6471)
MDDVAAAQWVRGTLRSEMIKRGWSYADLVRELGLRGITETEQNLRNKVSRGTFSAIFFFQCMDALAVPVLHLDELSIVSSIAAKRITKEGLTKVMDPEMAAAAHEMVDGVQAVLDAGEKARKGE